MKEESLQLNQEKKPVERITKLPIPEPHMTQKEVAEVLGVHRHDVAKLEADALKKLKRRLEAAGYSKDSFF